MKKITLTKTVSDACDPNPSPASCAVSANELLAADDVQWINGELHLRAERAGNNGDGRIYTIACTTSDASGNTAESTTTVIVPHNH